MTNTTHFSSDFFAPIKQAKKDFQNISTKEETFPPPFLESSGPQHILLAVEMMFFFFWLDNQNWSYDFWETSIVQNYKVFLLSYVYGLILQGLIY